MTVSENLLRIKKDLPSNVTLVAVSKTHPISAISEALEVGQLDFGENKVQELVQKQQQLSPHIRWHMIGHLQSNKVKYIAPFVHLIHGVDSPKLLEVIQKEGVRCNRKINCLLQVHIATESSKFGFSGDELIEYLSSNQYKTMTHINLQGLMGMATFTNDHEHVKTEFNYLKQLFDQLKRALFSEKSDFTILSMGMSDDYDIAIAQGSSMVRIGSSIFGHR